MSVSFDLHVRGSVPPALSGSLIVPTSRRAKDRRVFSRWHDAQADLIRLDLVPGRPGRISAHVLEIDPAQVDLGPNLSLRQARRREEAATPGNGHFGHPNHGVNQDGHTVWATNLLFGAPVEIDLASWTARRLLRYVNIDELAPGVSGTSHFAWSLDRRCIYFHQSALRRETAIDPVQSHDLRLIELEVASGREHTWRIVPPEGESLATANFHSAFYYEEDGRRFVGLLRTGALLERLAPHGDTGEHDVRTMPASTIWVVELTDDPHELRAELLPGIKELDGLALSHLDVDASSGDGFVLYANFKEADVAEETHGPNLYGEAAGSVAEHYSGMVIESLNCGLVIRYERRGGRWSIRRFSRPYDPARTSRGHSWLPINIELDPAHSRLFCTFSGFRPRLLPRHVAEAYPDRLIDPAQIRHVPPLLMRLDAETLEPDDHGDRGHLSYSQPIAIAVAGDDDCNFVCTFSPEVGLRIYRADDLSNMVCQAESPSLVHWRDSHFRPEPAHMQFVAR